MIDWERLLMAVLCAVTLICGSIALTRFFPNVFLAFIVVAFVCALTLAFYMLLDDISDEYNSLKNKGK